MNNNARKATLGQARYLRRAMVSTERRLWDILRDRRLDRLKFRRQHRLGPYIVDFICLRYRLIVEADGPFHDPERDAVRDAWLRSQGYEVFRFSNEAVFRDWDRILDRLVVASGGRSIFPDTPIS